MKSTDCVVHQKRIGGFFLKFKAHRLMATLVKWGFPMGGRGSPDGVGGQFGAEGWHGVVGRVDRAGWRRGVG